MSEKISASDFAFPSRLYEGAKALDLTAVLKRKIRPAFGKIGITVVGWHTFRHTVRSKLAEPGGHQSTVRDFLRQANPSLTKSI